MITVTEAQQIMMAQVRRTSTVHLALAQAAGHHLAGSVMAPHDHPLFDMSAVDGYAFAFGSATANWRVVATLAAGDVHGKPLEAGECARIFTGAMVPAGADTVVMQEFVSRSGDTITHNDVKLVAGGNVRRQGEQVRKGEEVLPAGTHIGAAAIGLLASVGARKVHMHVRPKVNVLRTGGEFLDQKAPTHGRIFSSNDVMLVQALEQAGLVPCDVFTAEDDPSALERSIRDAMEADVLITTGGVSVGDHDLLRPTLEKLGATIHFHGVAQKPGKPMLFATLNGTPVFALPGNPRAVLVLYHMYVQPFLRAMQGDPAPGQRKERLPIAHAVRLKGQRAEFRAAVVRNGQVTLLADEGSHMLRTLIDADALAMIPADVRALEPGDPVEVHYLGTWTK